MVLITYLAQGTVILASIKAAINNKTREITKSIIDSSSSDLFSLKKKNIFSRAEPYQLSDIRELKNL